MNAPRPDRRRDPETRRLAGFLPRLPGKSGASPDRRRSPPAASRPDSCRTGEEEEEEEVQTEPSAGGWASASRPLWQSRVKAVRSLRGTKTKLSNEVCSDVFKIKWKHEPNQSERQPEGSKSVFAYFR